MEKIRYKAIIAYDGTDFSGFQYQPNRRTIQGELEKALTQRAKSEPIRIHGAGRTDAGVHARGQVIHFDFPFFIEPKGLLIGLNASTPPEISLLSIEVVDETFHSRYLAKAKKYQYRIDNNETADPFLRLYAYNHRYPMNRSSLEEALKHLEGTHDFTSFASTHAEVTSKVRTLYQASVEVEEDTNEWTFTFIGDGFLYNMIRILMGTLLQVADGRIAAEEIPKIIAAKDREMAGPTLSPIGLRMETVYYDEDSIPGYSKETTDD